MRLVSVLRDAGVRESQGDPVRMDAVLPRPPEPRETAWRRRATRHAEGCHGPNPPPDSAGERDQSPRSACWGETRTAHLGTDPVQAMTRAGCRGGGPRTAVLR